MKTACVIGRSTPPYDDALLEKCRVLGKRIAQDGLTLLSGACPGYPHASVQAASLSGGKTVGYSPGENEKHHMHSFSSPRDAFTEIRYFGDKNWSNVKNFTWRSAHLIDDADVVFCVEGSWGTLSEIALVFETEKPLGVLNSPGASSFVKTLEQTLARRRKAHVHYSSDPVALFDAVVGR